MNTPADFYTKFKTAYDGKQIVAVCELVLDLLRSQYPNEMAGGLVDSELIEMYLSVLEEQKIYLNSAGDIDLYILEPAREKLLGIEDDEDDWGL